MAPPLAIDEARLPIRSRSARPHDQRAGRQLPQEVDGRRQLGRINLVEAIGDDHDVEGRGQAERFERARDGVHGAPAERPDDGCRRGADDQHPAPAAGAQNAVDQVDSSVCLHFPQQ